MELPPKERRKKAWNEFLTFMKSNPDTMLNLVPSPHQYPETIEYKSSNKLPLKNKSGILSQQRPSSMSGYTNTFSTHLNQYLNSNAYPTAVTLKSRLNLHNEGVAGVGGVRLVSTSQGGPRKRGLIPS